MKTRHYSTPCFVLRTRITGEQDLLIELLTPSVGVVYALAKNALKSQRRFQGCLDAPTLIDGSFTRRGDFLYLEEAAVLDGFRDLPHDPVRFVLAGYVVECLLATAGYQDEGSPWFEFLGASLAFIRQPPQDILMKKLLIDLKLLDLHGLQPSLDVCTYCDDEESGRPLVGLDIRAGTAVCAEHVDTHSSVLRPTRGVLKALHRLSPPELRHPRAIVFTPRQLKEALEVAGTLLEEHLSLRPNSLRSLGQLLRRERLQARATRSRSPSARKGASSTCVTRS